MSDYTECKMRDLLPGDLVIEPLSGALARVNTVVDAGTHVSAQVTMVVGESGATLLLPTSRTMRRKWRRGERTK